MWRRDVRVAAHRGPGIGTRASRARLATDGRAPSLTRNAVRNRTGRESREQWRRDVWRRDVRVAAHRGPGIGTRASRLRSGGRCSSLRSFDAIGGAIAGGTAPKRVTGRPAATIQGRCLRSAHCPHCVFSPFFSRGDIDRRAFQRASPPSATGVREAPPQGRDLARGRGSSGRYLSCVYP